YRERKASGPLQGSKREALQRHRKRPWPGKAARLGAWGHPFSSHIESTPARVQVASPSGRRENAVGPHRRTSTRWRAHWRDGHLGWRVSTVMISWRPYVWKTVRPASSHEVATLEQEWGV